MALSNIFNEPRREITETLVGIGGVLVIPGLLYVIGQGVNAAIGYRSLQWYEAMVVGLSVPLFLGVALAILFGVAILLHKFGEAVCALLDGFGLELRPKREAPKLALWPSQRTALNEGATLRIRLPETFAVAGQEAAQRQAVDDIFGPGYSAYAANIAAPQKDVLSAEQLGLLGAPPPMIHGSIWAALG